VRFSGCEVAQHERSIVPDVRGWPLLSETRLGREIALWKIFRVTRAQQDVTIYKEIIEPVI
jgi:hypothetical protein